MFGHFPALNFSLEPAELDELEQAYLAAFEVLKPGDLRAREGLAFDILQSYRGGARDRNLMLAEVSRKYGVTAAEWAKVTR
ncbi:MAG: hypothetical protein JWN93_1222 [Hyphomicrobiales bacterium]|nr:hypothetical protein [Hyphomicrobiales bacterium]